VKKYVIVHFWIANNISAPATHDAAERDDQRRTEAKNAGPESQAHAKQNRPWFFLVVVALWGFCLLYKEVMDAWMLKLMFPCLINDDN
jgi:hypothetical protein